MAVILLIRRKTQNNQSINQSINPFLHFHRRDGVVVKSSPRMREIGVRSSVGTDLSS